MSNVIPWPGQVDQDAISINFLERVLPAHGLYCACVKQGKSMVQSFHETIESLWITLREADRSGRDVYFAPASFSSNERTVEACAEKRSLHLDIDYGPGHAKAGYETAEDAIAALKVFCPKVGLPLPMVVKSGGGFHVHWPFKESIARAKWQRYADGLKAACLEHGLRADHSLTINSVVILRPPGTFNRKLSAARPVELGPEWLVGPYDWPDELLGYAANTVVRLRAKQIIPPKPEYLDAITFPSEAFPDHYELVKIERLVQSCGVTEQFHRSGDVSEPVWMRLANLFHYVEDGARLFQELSQRNYPRYDRVETQRKWDRANGLTGPPLCEGFKDNTDAETRAICLACPLLDKIKTPLQGVEHVADTTLGEDNSFRSSDSLRDHTAADLAIPKKPPYVEWDKTDKGVIRATYKNTAIAIGKLEPVCSHDTFHMKKYVGGQDLDDAILRVMREQIITRFRFDPGKEHVGEALSRECERNPFDPVKEYLESLRWDGLARLDRWLCFYLGADDTELNRVFGRKVLLAAVRRVRQRGCKFDYMLILEGMQGAGKSSAWQILAGSENFSDAQIKWDDPKQQRELMGAWIHEVSELVGLRKADVDAIKSFLSRQVDRGRAAYDRFPSDQPRRGIIVGTINPRPGMGYLTDPTGARRFWPVKVGWIALDALREDRDQLWAEAVQIEATGESLELPPHLWQAAADEQDLRRVADPWLDLLSAVQGERVASMDIMIRDLGLSKDRISPVDAGRVASIMKRLGWDGPKMIRVDGKPVRGYERTT